MAKNNSMQKQIVKDEMLIDVGPENGKVIIEAVREYKKHQADRLAAGKKEFDAKQKVLTLVKEAELQRLPDGTIKFTYEKVIIKVTPQDDLITIKEEKPKKAKKPKRKG